MIRINIDRKMPIAITIAGSDSGGGAGIQADLKTFAALQVYGTAAITSITAQNTYSVIGIQDIDTDIIEKQILAVYEDMGIDAGKTGMLHTGEIIERVADIVGKLGFPLVVDPVMVAKSGAKLVKDEAIDTMIDKLFKVATIVTPNKHEAEILSNISINDLGDMEEAAKIIFKLGPKVVVIKGGHLPGDRAHDLVYDGKNVKIFSSSKYSDETTHGTGCSFSAAIAAFLAHKYDILYAIREAKNFISDAIKFGLKIGKGVGPVNPLAPLYRDASRYQVINEVKVFLDKISRLENISKLIPEVGMNVAYSTVFPRDKRDIAAIPGRIRKIGDEGIIYEMPDFGASDHLSRYLLKAREYNPRVRAVVNIRYDEKFIKMLSEKGLSVGSYDRSREPLEYKIKEGYTIGWGVEYVYKSLGYLPSVIYHKGDVGKEPMIILISESLDEIYGWIRIILKEIGNEE